MELTEIIWDQFQYKCFISDHVNLKLHNSRVVNLALPDWHVWPHPVEQHSSSAEQSVCLEQASTQMPTVPGLIGGHFSFANVRPAWMNKWMNEWMNNWLTDWLYYSASSIYLNNINDNDNDNENDNETWT